MRPARPRNKNPCPCPPRPNARRRTDGRASPFVRDRIIQHCNQGFCQMLGYGEDELTLQSTRCLYQHESDYQLVGHQTRHSPLATDMALQRKDGSTVWCAIHAKLVNPDDPDAGMVVVIMDISARKAAEHDMQESRQH